METEINEDKAAVTVELSEAEKTVIGKLETQLRNLFKYHVQPEKLSRPKEITELKQANAQAKRLRKNAIRLRRMNA